MRQKFKSQISALSGKRGSDLNRKSAGGFFRWVIYRIRSRFSKRPAIVMVDRPRDLDDPLDDLNFQARAGEAIAKRAKRRPK